MKTKSMKKPKKLTPRARKKEATGIQVEAAKVRDRAIELKLKKLEALHKNLSAYCEAMNLDLGGLFDRVERLEKVREGRK